MNSPRRGRCSETPVVPSWYTEISAVIKGLARELNIPIIVVAQLNRQPEERKPRLSGLRESDSLIGSPGMPGRQDLEKID
jgi:DnaB helicase-like protein